MPKKKSGARKKAERQKQVQLLKGKHEISDVAELACNQDMTCDACQKRQRTRAFCYFCQSLPKLPMCGHCAKTKCMAISGDCLVKHPTRHVIGLQFVGAICDYCEAFVCHSWRCVDEHSCPCPLANAVCIECERELAEHGGRMFRCCNCAEWLCEDCQFEHQASCQQLDKEDFKCVSCNRLGLWSCMRCKICICADHVKVPTGARTNRSEVPSCKRCRFPLQPTKDKSVSVRKHAFGRKTATEVASDLEGRGESAYDGEYASDDDQNPLDAPFARFDPYRMDYEVDYEDDGGSSGEEESTDSNDDEGEEAQTTAGENAN